MLEMRAGLDRVLKSLPARAAPATNAADDRGHRRVSHPIVPRDRDATGMREFGVIGLASKPLFRLVVRVLGRQRRNPRLALGRGWNRRRDVHLPPSVIHFA